VDYLAFGLLAGSLIVIASFVVRDGLPHLSVIGDGSRLDRWSRSETPQAWGRWCADAGLVLAGAGTVVLLITVAALLVGLSDGAGNMLIGLSAAAAVVASALGIARLTQRLRVEADAELTGDLDLFAPPAPEPAPTRRTKPAPRFESAAALVGAPVGARDDVWDDELPIWSPSPGRPEAAAVEPAAGLTMPSQADSLAESEPVEPIWSAPISDPERSPRSTGPTRRLVQPPAPPDQSPGAESDPPAIGGVFRSPLLADIGLTPLDGKAEDGFRSPLLTDLHEVERDDDADLGGGSDLLIDEAPAPVQPAGRLRDEMNNR